MQWICNIAVFLVFSGILLEMIADTKYYRFARWVAGVILLLQFIKPWTETEEFWGKFVSRFQLFDYALGTDRVLDEIYAVNGQTESSVLANYKESVTAQIERLLRNNGLRLVRTELSVAGDGTLERIFVVAVYEDKEEPEGILIPTIAPVQIGTGQEKNILSPLELYLIEELAEFYQIDKNRIEVMVQEAV